MMDIFTSSKTLKLNKMKKIFYALALVASLAVGDAMAQTQEIRCFSHRGGRIDRKSTRLNSSHVT